jgi:hypothetical protein
LPDVKISPAGIVIALAGILIFGAFSYLTFGPKPAPPPPPVLTEEAREYLEHLQLDNVRMQQSDSMVDQRVIEILGTIINHGTRTIKLAEVTCVFRDYDNKEVKRERLPIVSTSSLSPNDSKTFRLAFDDVPQTWNQVMPTLVIAQIQFK